MKKTAGVFLVGILFLFLSSDAFAQCAPPDPTVIQLVYPNPRAQGATPVFTWTAATNMDSPSAYYELYIWDAEDQTHPTDYPAIAHGTSWQMTNGSLSVGHTYAWKIRPVNGCGGGGFTNVVLFYAAGGSPVSTTTTTAISSTTTTAPGSGKVCAMSYALGDARDDRALNLVREFRNSVLLRTPRGRKYIAWYYKHSIEVAGIIRNNPAIREEMKQALYAVLPQIDSLVRGATVTISPEVTEKIDALCAAVEIEAGDALRKDLESFRTDLTSGTMPDCILIRKDR